MIVSIKEFLIKVFSEPMTIRYINEKNIKNLCERYVVSLLNYFKEKNTYSIRNIV